MLTYFIIFFLVLLSPPSIGYFRSLVRRYITNEQRQSERQRGVTEDDCNEIKQDISALRFELIELLQRGKSPNLLNSTTSGYSANFTGYNSGHNVTTCNNTTGPVLTTARTFDLGSLVNNVVGKRGRKRERRLMKGFDFNFLFMDTTTSIDEPELSRLESKSSIKSTNVKSPSSTRNKFVRLAKGIAGKRGSRANRWKQLIEATKNKVCFSSLLRSLLFPFILLFFFLTSYFSSTSHLLYFYSFTPFASFPLSFFRTVIPGGQRKWRIKSTATK